MIQKVKAYFKKHGINNITSVYLFHHPYEDKSRVQRVLQGRSKNIKILTDLNRIYEQYKFNRNDT